MPTTKSKQPKPSIDFEEYKRQGEPNRVAKSQIWKTAIGLQQVDGLQVSDYLIATAKKNIEDEISIDEVEYRINEYYKAKPTKKTDDDRTAEADKVSTRITKILSNDTFSFSPVEYTSIHRQLFNGIYKFAGKIRDYNISKEEWVLNAKSVLYANAETIRDMLEYDFQQEKKFDYRGLSKLEAVAHIAKFISGIWQIHPFGEGNTRTAAVFAIKYLRSFGFEVNNEPFDKNARYFRNALVRANYNDHQQGIYATQEYLMKFFWNLLLGEKHELKNRHLKVDTVNDTVKVKNDTVNDTVISLIHLNPDITTEKLAEKLNISIATVKRRIKKLKDEGVLTRVGSDKTGYWKVNEW